MVVSTRWERIRTEAALGYVAFAYIAFGEIRRLLALARVEETSGAAGFTPAPFIMPRMQFPTDLWWTREDLEGVFAVTTGPDAELVGRLLTWFHLIDMIFVLALARILYVVLIRLGLPARLEPRETSDDDESAVRQGTPFGWVTRAFAWLRPDARTLTMVYAVADLAETTFALAVTVDRQYLNAARMNLISLASAVKWLALLVIGTVILLLAWRRIREAAFTADRERSAPRSRTVWARLVPISVVVGIFVVLMAVPGGSALTQLPDILRSGVERLDLTGGAGEFLSGVLFLGSPLLLAASVWLAAWIATARPAGRAPRLAGWLAWWWPVLVGAVASLAIGVTLWWIGDPKWAASVWFAVPFAVVVLGGLARWSSQGRSEPLVAPGSRRVSRPEPVSSEQRQSAAAILATIILTATALGLVRAALPPVLLEIGSSDGAALMSPSGPGSAGAGDLYPLFLGVAIAGAVLTPVGMEIVQTLVDRVPWLSVAVTGVGGTVQRALTWVRERPVIAGLSLVLLLGVLLWAPLALAINPGDIAPALGTTGVIMVTFSFAVLVFAVLAQASLRTPSWEALRYLRIRGGRPSWLGYLVLVWVAASLAGGPAGYHDARTQAALAGPAPTLDEALTQWISTHTGTEAIDAAACVTAEGGRRVVPLVLVASPGGGIRAAYWTAATMDRLFTPAVDVTPGAGCASHVFAFAGASGGSVGGTVRLLTPPDEESLPAVRVMAEDQALAANIAALFFRDLPQAFFPANHLWHDRAEVHERVWMQNAPVFTTDGSANPDQPVASSAIGAGWAAGEAQPGALLLAASINDGCRAFTTSWSGTVPPGNGCSSRVDAPGFTLTAAHDLASALVDPRTIDDDEPAAAELPAVTSAFLSARFPYVSPTGAVRRDPSSGTSPDVLYLADGGIYENTALLGLLQVWDHIEGEVARHNLETAQPGGVLIEPWLVYLPSGFEDPNEVPNTNRPRELAAPIASILQRVGQATIGEAALLQAADLRFSGELPGLGDRPDSSTPGTESGAVTTTGADHSETGGSSEIGDSSEIGNSSEVGGTTSSDAPIVDVGSRGRVVVIRPGMADPGLTAPLGWVLAPSSQAALDAELDGALRQERAVELLGRLNNDGDPGP